MCGAVDAAALAADAGVSPGRTSTRSSSFQVGSVAPQQRTLGSLVDAAGRAGLREGRRLESDLLWLSVPGDRKPNSRTAHASNVRDCRLRIGRAMR
jgi:hypothetical protein